MKTKATMLMIVLLVFGLNSFSHAEVAIIDLSQTKAFLQAGAVFIDNRPEYMYKDGHIEGAVNLPYFAKGHPTNRMTKENLLAAIGTKKTLVFYCSGASRALHALMQAREWVLKRICTGIVTEWQNGRPNGSVYQNKSTTPDF